MRLDLQHGPLLAAFVMQDTSGELLLSLLCHHIVCDHVSIELILAEIKDVLAGHGQTLAAPLPYRNFVAEHTSSAGNRA